MASIDEVKTAINRGITDSEQALGGAHAVKNALADALTIAHATGQGSQDFKISLGLAKLDEAHDEISTVLRLLDASISAAQDYQRNIG